MSTSRLEHVVEYSVCPPRLDQDSGCYETEGKYVAEDVKITEDIPIQLRQCLTESAGYYCQDEEIESEIEKVIKLNTACLYRGIISVDHSHYLQYYG